MNAKAETHQSKLDTAKIIVALALLAAGLGGFYYFESQLLLWRVLGLLAVAGVSAFIALQTDPGRRLLEFASDARNEVRKVVWPTRQETIQTTLVVLVMVLILGLVLWLIDTVLLAIVRALTG